MVLRPKSTCNGRRPSAPRGAPRYTPARKKRAPGTPPFAATRKWQRHRVSSIDESVPETDHGLDLAAGGAEFGAQATDVHINRARFDEALVAPDALEQPIA